MKLKFGTKLLFKSLLILQIIYLTLTFFIPGLPGWKMFSRLEKHAHFIMLDETQKPIDYQTMLPTVVYQLDKQNVLMFSEFACKKIKGKSLTVIFENQEKYELAKPLCRLKKI